MPFRIQFIFICLYTLASCVLGDGEPNEHGPVYSPSHYIYVYLNNLVLQNMPSSAYDLGNPTNDTSSCGFWKTTTYGGQLWTIKYEDDVQLRVCIHSDAASEYNITELATRMGYTPHIGRRTVGTVRCNPSASDSNNYGTANGADIDFYSGNIDVAVM